MKRASLLLILTISLSCFIGSSCKNNKKEGKLFIIGGGDISSAVIDKMITESGIDKEGYGIILPMSSSEPDSAVYYTKADFTGRGRSNVYGLSIKKGETMPQCKIDSISNAKMVFISGGDQSRFMDIIAGSPVKEAIHKAFENGNLICGTSAGAALMSKKMITGNELKYADDSSSSGSFKTIEANNIEIIEGLGMLENVIIDQHFIKRKRLNRLISVCMENPESLCVGIDESTAILVDRNTATVYGDNQVIAIRHGSPGTKTENGLLGARDLRMDIILPGESFSLKK